MTTFTRRGKFFILLACFIFFLQLQLVAGFSPVYVRMQKYHVSSSTSVVSVRSSSTSSSSSSNSSSSEDPDDDTPAVVVDPRVTEQQVAAIQRFQTLADQTFQKQLEEYANIHSIIEDLLSPEEKDTSS